MCDAWIIKSYSLTPFVCAEGTVMGRAKVYSTVCLQTILFFYEKIITRYFFCLPVATFSFLGEDRGVEVLRSSLLGAHFHSKRENGRLIFKNRPHGGRELR